jgi:6-phosphogluconolactonase (cycloisomerase 2 family)
MKTAIIGDKGTLPALLICACIGFPTAASAGAVYAMTNSLGNNEIKVYSRAGDGSLSMIQSIATTGGGSGFQLAGNDSLGSQGSLILDQNHGRLFAVNTETQATHYNSGPETGDCREGSISSFTVGPDGTLTFVQKIPSGGLFPNSLTVSPSNNLLYVLNAGGPGLNPRCGRLPNITGFTLSNNGEMTPLAGSTRAIEPGMSPGTFLKCDPAPSGSPFSTYEYQCGLNPPAYPRSPAQVGFDRTGLKLAVTEKGTNTIYTFPVNGDGTPGLPTLTHARGPNQPTYFGFAFDSLDHLIVAETFGATPVLGTVPGGAVSSFTIEPNGSLDWISLNVPTQEGTSCWVALFGQYAYISDSQSSAISLYSIGVDGSLTLLAESAAVVVLPIDMSVTPDGFLYVLGGGLGRVAAFRINANGSLTSVQSIGGLPAYAGAQGLAAY